jgi:hypothetical protein
MLRKNCTSNNRLTSAYFSELLHPPAYLLRRIKKRRQINGLPTASRASQSPTYGFLSHFLEQPVSEALDAPRLSCEIIETPFPTAHSLTYLLLIRVALINSHDAAGCAGDVVEGLLGYVHWYAESGQIRRERAAQIVQRPVRQRAACIEPEVRGEAALGSVCATPARFPCGCWASSCVRDIGLQGRQAGHPRI